MVIPCPAEGVVGPQPWLAGVLNGVSGFHSEALRSVWAAGPEGNTEVNAMSDDDTGIDVLVHVVRLLCRCSDLAFEQARCEPSLDFPGLGLGAQLLAEEAMDLLPVGVELDQPLLGCGDARWVLRAAEELTRSLPIESYPPGMSQVIAGLCDLVGEYAR